MATAKYNRFVMEKSLSVMVVCCANDRRHGIAAERVEVFGIAMDAETAAFDLVMDLDGYGFGGARQDGEGKDAIMIASGASRIGAADLKGVHLQWSFGLRGLVSRAGICVD